MAWNVTDAELAEVVRIHDECIDCALCPKDNPDRCLHYRMAVTIRRYKSELKTVAANLAKD